MCVTYCYDMFMIPLSLDYIPRVLHRNKDRCEMRAPPRVSDEMNGKFFVLFPMRRIQSFKADCEDECYAHIRCVVAFEIDVS